MATTDDIDTKSAVRKFLESGAVVDRENPAANSADEIQAILESVALSFLLYPQAALSFVLQSKNVLQQVVATDLAIVDYLLAAIGEVENPDEPVSDTSDLVDAQTALVEVDRIGRVSTDVRAYGRYTDAINNFLDSKLAKALKRNRTGELERTGTEAKQDMFRVLNVFAPTHALMATKLVQLLDGVSDFNSVSLTKIVSSRTLTRVRASLNKVIQGVQKNTISKTAVAIELLAGAAALSSISNSRNVNDPTVDTGSYPVGRIITVSSERVAATASGTGSTVDLSGSSTPWVFGVSTESASYSIEIPYAGASGRCWVATETGSQTYDISSSNRTIYVEFDGIAPDTTGPVLLPKRVRAVTLPTGSAVSITAVLAALNDVSTGLIDGTAVQLGSTGRILIYGSSSVTGIVVRRSSIGTFDISGNYTEAAGSAHDVLGFADDQTSGDPNKFSPADVVSLVSPYVDTATLSVGDVLTVSSLSTALISSLSFSGVASNFGLTAVKALPTYLELQEAGVAVDPATLGVFVGSVFTVSDISLSSRSLFAPVISINGTKIYFSQAALPRCSDTNVRVVSPLVFAVQSLYDNIRKYVGAFDSDALTIQRVLSPLLSKPTVAQLNDAKRAITAIRTTVNNLLTALSNTVVSKDVSEFSQVADQVAASLQERGLDRGLELLQSCLFSDFFSLTSEVASKGTRFLKASEEVGRNDLASTTIEQNQDDLAPTATTPDQNLLPGEELLEDEEQQ